MREKIIIGLASIALMALIFGMIMRKVSIPLPESIQMHDPTTAEEKKGRDILNKMLLTHGGKSHWEKYKTSEAVVTHNITFAPYRWMFGYYSHYPQRIKMTTLLGTDNGRWEFLDGPRQGKQWGLQNWACYKIEPGEEPVFEQDFGFFYVATGPYFLLLPFRIQEANTVALIGEREWEGKIYDLVMATWDGFEPKKTIDQHVLWISRETERLDYMTFSVRDQGSFVVATISYMDYRNIDGLLLSFEHRMVMGNEPDHWPQLHHLKYDSITLYETADEQFFFPRPNLSYSKPSNF